MKIYRHPCTKSILRPGCVKNELKWLFTSVNSLFAYILASPENKIISREKISNKLIIINRFFLFVGWFLLAVNVHAGQWVEVGDAKLRHYLQVLSDGGLLSAPVTSWPLTWESVSEDLHDWQQKAEDKDSDYLDLPRMQQQALVYVQAAHAQSSLRQNRLNAGVRDNINIQPHFGYSQREEQLYQFSTEKTNEHYAYKVQLAYVDDASDDRDFRLDGSYLAGFWNDWQLSLGAVDRWWGPGWHSNLILTNSARPVPGLSFQRNSTRAFSAPVLRWLGPWQLIVFTGQLENNRAIPEANLIGMRYTMKPFPWLELGASRSAQWGGEGRSRSLENFIDLALGNDNADTGISSDADPGNQLGGVDFRLGGTILGQTLALYAQLIGEDETDYAPSKRIIMAGLETAFVVWAVQSRMYLEYIDTVANGYKGQDLYNIIYNHGTYQSGYRYRGRPIGFALDNDAREMTLAASHYFRQGNALAWSASRLKLNIDGSSRAPFGNVWSLNRQEFWLGDIHYEHEF